MESQWPPGSPSSGITVQCSHNYHITSYKTRWYYFFIGSSTAQVLLDITKFHLHKSVPGADIIKNAGIIRGRALYEEIRYWNLWKYRSNFSSPGIVVMFNSVMSVILLMLNVRNTWSIYVLLIMVLKTVHIACKSIKPVNAKNVRVDSFRHLFTLLLLMVKFGGHPDLHLTTIADPWYFW